MFDKINATVSRIKTEKPLILNITNYVTMDFIANGLLSLGASPVMSQAPQELEDLIGLAQAVVVNPGTLDDKFNILCEHTCKIANQLRKPVILDPVGAGATYYRTSTYLKLLNNYDIAIIRANASEVMALAGAAIATKGVDSTEGSHSAIESGKALSNQYGATVLISGAEDIIIEEEKLSQFSYGSPLMPNVTGTGCLMSAVVAAFHTVEANKFAACSMAAIFYGVCGEAAAKKADGPGSFKKAFIDQLSLLPTCQELKNAS